ncbi:uncharacterized protein LOC143422314 [Xylocopa sonorina]|uniref:uncharacterized protein LOC143422314 n=1 Tax=Xylocopa sonorina TaxID=1818115 RepID=UPI00403B0672
MTKTDINNEIVLLRKSVRQARIHVINKLVREAKKLRSSHDNEKQLEKFKNKADKLLREVIALKRIKNDDISKFGINNFKDVQRILQNPHTDDGTRAMAKVICHKSLSQKILEVQKKCQNCNNYVSSIKKKHPAKRKGNSSADFSAKHSEQLQSDTNDITNEVQKEDTKDTDDVSDKRLLLERKGKLVDLPQIDSKQLQSYTNDKVKKKQKESIKNVKNPGVTVACGKNGNCDAKSKKLFEEMKENSEMRKDEGNSIKVSKVSSVNVNDKSDDASKPVVKVISNEATVKRFTEILQETGTQNDRCKETENQQLSKLVTGQSKLVDDFFIYGDETISCPRATLISKHIDVSDTHNDSHDTFKAYQIENKRNRFYNEYSKARRDSKKQKVDNKYLSRNQNITEERSNVHQRQNKRITQVEERSVKSINAESINLHPSWAAKKKQQDIMKQGFQGKKIKFDET